jgi:type VI secretion system secreted protein VgrG
MPTSQDGRSLQLSTPLGEDYLLANHFTCSEGLNELFHMKLDLLHEEPVEGFKPTEIDAKQLLGNQMVLAAVQADGKQRFFHGMCIQFTQTSRNERFSEYRAEVVPKVWLLTQVSQSRIFQQMNVPDILTKVLAGFEFENELQETYERRNYCVQYRETDWDFISRLM